MIFAIKPFEIHDGDGIRTTVFFKGCPLRCKWCHNPESFSPKQEILFDPDLCRNCLKCTSLCDANTAQSGHHIFNKEKCTLCGACEEACPAEAFELSGWERSPEQIAGQVLRDELIFKGSGGGVTFSGGEPLLQPELCVALGKLLKQRDIHIAIDSCGYVQRSALEQVIPYTDQFLFDVKAIDPQVHRNCTGVSNQLILENIRYADSFGIPMEIRYPYVPTMNDGEAEAIGDFVKKLKNVTVLRVLPYHSYAEQKYRRAGLPFTPFPTPTKQEMEDVLARLHRHGVPAAGF